MRIKGEYTMRRVWVDDEPLSPKRSQKVWNHSPDGFNWGYGGSGPAQLALAILLLTLEDEEQAIAIMGVEGFDRVHALSDSEFLEPRTKWAWGPQYPFLHWLRKTRPSKKEATEAAEHFIESYKFPKAWDEKWKAWE